MIFYIETAMTGRELRNELRKIMCAKEEEPFVVGFSSGSELKYKAYVQCKHPIETLCVYRTPDDALSKLLELANYVNVFNQQEWDSDMEERYKQLVNRLENEKLALNKKQEEDEIARKREEAKMRIRNDIRKHGYIGMIKRRLGLKVGYDIWSEGYNATGMQGGAVCHARGVKGKDFFDAVQHWYNSLKNPNDYGRLDIITNRDGVPVAAYLWGCRLYDNEEQARQTFG